VDGLLDISKEEFQNRIDWMHKNHTPWKLFIIILTC
jgi:hypothetical protein